MGRTAGRPRHTTHAAIRDTARALFTEHGFDNVSLARIAAAAGIGRTTLFAYYPAKTTLMSEELEAHTNAAIAYLDTDPEGSALDVVAEAIRRATDYSIAEHDDFARRRAIVRDSVELQSAVARHAETITTALAAAAGARVPEPNRMLAGDLARALMAVASRAIDDWSAQPPEVALDEYVALRIAPLRAAFAALLPA
jgi:AcrR family transcriptional regulator